MPVPSNQTENTPNPQGRGGRVRNTSPQEWTITGLTLRTGPDPPLKLQMRDPKGSNCFQGTSLDLRTKLKKSHRITKAPSTQQGKTQDVWHPVRLQAAREAGEHECRG